MKGLRIDFALSEFTTAAAFLTLAVCLVGFFMRHVAPPAPACVAKETVVENHYITVPAPIVHVRVVVPKPDPPVIRVPVEGELPAVPPTGKVWDNDNIPHASDPLVLKAENK